MTGIREVRAAGPPDVREDFAAFFRREYPRSVKLAWLLTRSASVAEDLAQEAMLGVHARFDDLDQPSAYLTRVLVNRCHSWYRRAAVDMQTVRSLSAASQQRVDPAGEYLLDAVHALPYRQRVVVVARYWGDWSEAEIAAALGCRLGTVKSLASRALARLRTELPR